MNERTYIVPGLDGWSFKTSDAGCGLWSGLGGPGVTVTSEMPPSEIAKQVKVILQYSKGLTDEIAEAASQAVTSVDFQTMLREAGTPVQHQTPSLPGWTLRISDWGSGLWHAGGAGVQITADTPVAEIAESVKKVVQSYATSEESEAAAQEILKIDFKTLILNAWTPQVALMTDTPAADNSALVESICSAVGKLAALQKTDNTELVDQICALVKTLGKN